MIVFLDRGPVIESSNPLIRSTSYLIPRMPLHRRMGSRWWYVVVPIAAAVDAVTWPVERMMWVRYANAH